ncbi:RNA polymerase sigma-70 factor (ECF subfamily) [Dyadobacter jejuensis]|uniref:RNA polymerase sigma-70 factor (ECF subfamily) n=1 Tax=Dyadobacter jejuensis TaxID=1082580 RepID=A0A316B553_9BACT|nr:sigma-70 family RNA polymerase sigma factor [Dyadobacter jejuensis]PWJ57767.1 RNA polymerase sigma-70 factor (ECF subfamily) [Dyadobacter jejuensis]
MSHPDENTLRKVTLGDEEAFAQLYNYYRIPALRFSVSLLKDEEEAENLIQELFLKIWLRRTQIKPEQNFNSYFFTCLRNMAFDHFKKMEKNQQMRIQYLENIEAMADDEMEEKERRLVLVQTAVESLSTKRKLILKLNLEEGKSYQEIAEFLRISKNTVKNQLVKAKQLLREQVDFAIS